MDVTRVLKQLDGTPIVVDGQQCPMCGRGGTEGKDLTLRLASTRALTGMYQDEQGLPGDKKVARAVLAERIYKEDDVSLTAEEIAEIKTVLGKMWGPLVLLGAYRILDPNSVPGSDDNG